jgi:(5-formylfuran-3-yl)methyl phosphate synthase
MQLLVSVTNAIEASAALAGGADVIDAKDASVGALGAVTVDTLGEIWDVVSGARPVTAALGDAKDEAEIARSACAFAAAGAVLVKVGFAGTVSPLRVTALIAAAVHGAQAGNERTGVIAVAYADADRAGSIPKAQLVEVARRAGARGLLLDTADKHGPGLRGLVAPTALTAWVTEVHDAGLLVALAGQLTTADLSFVRDAGADIVGVRGAACEGGRNGRVTAEKVRLLSAQCVGLVGAAHASGFGPHS